MNDYYVYAYLDPRFDYTINHAGYTFENVPIYIGMSKNPDRMFDHLKNALINRIEKNMLKINVIRKILSEGMTPVIRRLAENLSREDACKLERCLIADIGTRELIENIKHGPLTNLRGGGEGGIMSKRTKEKLRQASLITAPITNADPRVKELIRNAHLGKAKSREHADKLRAHLAQKTNTPEQRARAAERMKLTQANMTAETRARISEANSKAISQTKWMLKNELCKRVPLERVTEHQADGWCFGRSSRKNCIPVDVR